MRRSPLSIVLLALLGCQHSPVKSSQSATDDASGDPAPAAGFADVEAVSWSSADGTTSFSVTIRSPDVDCSRYADWWELLAEDGSLVYRRILNHSHATEQPFERSGDPIKVADDAQLIVRGHMNDAGYGGVAFSGSVAKGFAAAPEIGAEFAASVEKQEPLPEECWW